jgi:2-oxoglutarate dehydrogenase E2 component (dihydrolipoamide succinyltransferase)
MDIKIPSVGESVVEALVAKWMVKNGSQVAKDDVLCELETDKITFELQAEASGTLEIVVSEGETVKIGTVIGRITETEVAAPAPGYSPPPSPSVRKMAAEKGLDTSKISGSGRGGRVTVADLLEKGTRSEERGTTEKPPMVKSEEPVLYEPLPASNLEPRTSSPRERRVRMTPIRKRIAERLLAARQQTAMLTTFNEADMSRIADLRSRHKEQMKERHGVSLGLMSFFVKSCCEALLEFPAVNASIDGEDIVLHNYYDIGIAIGSEKGLVVPVIREADRLHFWEIEKRIADFTQKIKENRLALADLEGGTFTISNGGVYGSLLSTPIINPPQTAVLGMHAIQERPVVRNGEIVIRPMMYLALSYDHRLIDGREAVNFLKRVKELIEEPEELLLEG